VFWLKTTATTTTKQQGEPWPWRCCWPLDDLWPGWPLAIKITTFLLSYLQGYIDIKRSIKVIYTRGTMQTQCGQVKFPQNNEDDVARRAVKECAVVVLASLWFLYKQVINWFVFLDKLLMFDLKNSKITFVGAWSLIRLNVKGMFL